jgi:hypothetical protein
LSYFLSSVRLASSLTTAGHLKNQIPKVRLKTDRPKHTYGSFVAQHATTMLLTHFVGFQHNDSISQDFSSKLSTGAALKSEGRGNGCALLRRDPQHSTQKGRK